jgi:hypothetical protein
MRPLPALCSLAVVLLTGCGGTTEPSQAVAGGATGALASEPTGGPSGGPTAEPTSGPTAEPSATAWVTGPAGVECPASEDLFVTGVSDVVENPAGEGDPDAAVLVELHELGVVSYDQIVPLALSTEPAGTRPVRTFAVLQDDLQQMVITVRSFDGAWVATDYVACEDFLAGGDG